MGSVVGCWEGGVSFASTAIRRWAGSQRAVNPASESLSSVVVGRLVACTAKGGNCCNTTAPSVRKRQ